MAESSACSICGEGADDRTSSICNSCGERFHLNQRNDQEGTDCGSVWIDEQHLGLEFACQRCLDAAQPPPVPAAPPNPRTLRPRVRRRYRKRA